MDLKQAFHLYSTPFHPFVPTLVFFHPFKSKNKARHSSEAPKCAGSREARSSLPSTTTLISDETISFVPSRKQIRNEGNKIMKELRQNRWNDSKNARWTKNRIDKVKVDRQYGDFYINQILTAHGVLKEHQARFFEKTSLCSCGQETGSVLHVIKECKIWTSYGKN
ncbi:hypothetical protein AVEN_84125-1 [Araneus ventricosus]|uniref:Uncharacterized protein n=1 Tax=Araneus ventricosus TaxID=182803 RepID=A0A4Y2P7R5_ARAVE|nr:hypothetical protein AVEN_84125-1 [Araneus ventricosus]